MDVGRNTPYYQRAPIGVRIGIFKDNRTHSHSRRNMGIYDYFEPDPKIDCPRCPGKLIGWTGRWLGASFFVWKQGVPAPIEHRVDDEHRLSPERLAMLRLSAGVDLDRNHCEECKYYFRSPVIEFIPLVVDGVWVDTLISPTPKVGKRLHESVYQCSSCSEVWEAAPAKSLLECPSCLELLSFR